MCAPCLYLRVRPPRAAIDSGGPTTVPGAVKLSDLPPNELLTDKRSLYIRKHFAVIVRYHEDGLAIPPDVLADAQAAMKTHQEKWAVRREVEANTSAYPAADF